MEAPVVLERSVDAELAELAVIDPADLNTDQTAGRVDDAHAPRQTPRGVGRSQRQEPAAALHRDALASCRDRLADRAHGRAGEDHSGRRESDRRGGEEQRERDQGDAQPRE